MSHEDGSDCQHDEVILGEEDVRDPESPLKPGMRVLIPCKCGETPLDTLSVLSMHLDEAQAVLKDFEPRRVLFHWSPAARRKQILRYGLRPGCRVTTSSARFDVVCFGDSPSWSWALSGEQRNSPSGQWDLWQTSLDLLANPTIIPGETRSSGIHEVRTQVRVPKSKLWYVASRFKP